MATVAGRVREVRAVSVVVAGLAVDLAGRVRKVVDPVDRGVKVVVPVLVAIAERVGRVVMIAAKAGADVSRVPSRATCRPCRSSRWT